ncbi:MAG: aspartate kinase, partial [Pseudomonadota bacterium]
SSGEQVTAGLMAITLQSLGLVSHALQGWQVPVETDAVHGSASIRNVGSEKLLAMLAAGEVPVIAGFQGVDPHGHVTTLGRGGSDTSAVAVAAAVKADRCDIYTDVDGVYTTDPRIVPAARRIAQIAYEEMLEMASLGAKVLHVRSVELAMLYNVPVLVRSSFDEPDRGETAGTLVCKGDAMMEYQVVSGIAHDKNDAKITVLGLRDEAGVAGNLFTPLADAAINVDMIVQNVSADGKTIDMTFTVPATEFGRATAILEKNKSKIAYDQIRGDKDIAKISCVGAGMRTHAGVAARMFSALGEQGINIQAITTSEIKVSILVAKKDTELAVQTLHSLYGLDRAS